MDNRFRWGDRLHHRREFSTVFKKGRRYSASGLVLWIYKDPDVTESRGPRLGLAITREAGNAVQRNRIKRLIREVFRLNKTELPSGVDMVFVSRTEFPKARYQTLEPLIKNLWQKA